MKIKRGIVLTDLQCPYECKKSLNAVEQYMSEYNWDYYLNLGDHLDYFCIAKYNVGKPGLVEGQTILNEVSQGESVLERHRRIIRANNPKSKMYLLEGNHDYRATDHVHRNPQLKGIIEPEVVLKLKEKGIEYIKCWSEGKTLQIGKAFFTHGLYVNQHHPKKMVEAYEENIFYGHTHDTNSFNKTSKANGKTKVGQSLGCMCKYPKGVDYRKGAPTKWQIAFTVFYFLPNGLFNYYIVRIHDGSFVSPEGKLYNGK